MYILDLGLAGGECGRASEEDFTEAYHAMSVYRGDVWKDALLSRSSYLCILSVAFI